jgi:integrase
MNQPAAPSPARLTEARIGKLPPAQPGRRYTRWDGELPAFGVRVTASGKKSFIVWYRVRGKVRSKRMVTLGRVGKTTLDQARREAQRLIGHASNAQDPLAARDAAKAGLTVAQAARRWLDEHVQPRRKPTTLRLYELVVRQHFQAIGKLPVTDLTTGHVTKLHEKLKATPTLANRAIATISSLCSWCEKHDLRPQHSNPCTGRLVERYGENQRKRYLTPQEYGRLGKALRAAERRKTASPIALKAIRLMLLTGCRPAEIVGLRWAEVDIKGAVLRLADSKTGAKTVHLPPEGVTLLRGWTRFAGQPFVFPGTGRRVVGAHLVNVSKPWAVLRKAAKLDNCRLYDAARHSFASVAMSAHGHSLSVVGELLGHSQQATTKRYAHLHDAVARQAVTAIGGTIATALAGKRVPAA